MMMRRMGLATTFLFLGFKEILVSPRLMLLSLAPFLIDIFLLATGYNYGSRFLQFFLDTAMGWIFSSKDSIWFQLAYYPMLVLFWIVFVVCLSATVYLIASVIAAPFNALMAETVLHRKGFVIPRRHGFLGFLWFSVRMIIVAAVRAVILISFSIFIFAVSFLPGVNILSAYLAAIVVAFDASDYSLEAKGYGLRQRFLTLRTLLPEYMGMGLILTLILLLPGVILLLMPIIVCGSAVVVGKALQEPS